MSDRYTGHLRQCTGLRGGQDTSSQDCAFLRHVSISEPGCGSGRQHGSAVGTGGGRQMAQWFPCGELGQAELVHLCCHLGLGTQTVTFSWPVLSSEGLWATITWHQPGQRPQTSTCTGALVCTIPPEHPGHFACATKASQWQKLCLPPDVSGHRTEAQHSHGATEPGLFVATVHAVS